MRWKAQSASILVGFLNLSEIILIHSNINHPLYNTAFLYGPLQSALGELFTGNYAMSKESMRFLLGRQIGLFCDSVGLKETCFTEVEVRCSEKRKDQSGEEMGHCCERWNWWRPNLRLTEWAKTRVKHHLIMSYLEHDAAVHRSETIARFGRDREET